TLSLSPHFRLIAPPRKSDGAFFFWAALPRRSLKGGTPARLCGAAWGTRTLCQKKDGLDRLNAPLNRPRLFLSWLKTVPLFAVAGTELIKRREGSMRMWDLVRDTTSRDACRR